MPNIGRGIRITHDREFFITIDKLLNRAGDNIMVFHIGNRHIGPNHLCHLTSKTARRIDHDLCSDLAQFCIDLPLAGGQTIDIRHAVMTHDFNAHVGSAAGHRVGEPRGVSVAIV